MKKLLSLTLAIILLIFSVNITFAEETDYPVYDETVNGDYIVNDSFDDSTVYTPRLNIGEVWQDVNGTNTKTGEIYTRDNNGNHEAVAARLVNNSNNSTNLLYYFKEDQTTITDDFVAFEFTMRKSYKREAFARIYGKNRSNKDRVAVDITWESQSRLIVKTLGDDNSTVKTIVLGSYEYGVNLAFKVLLCNELNTYDLWLDGNEDGDYEVKVENIKFRESSDAGISLFQTKISRDTGNVYIDNIKAYTIPADDEVHARFARGALKITDLTDEAATSITKNLMLPQTGKYDTDIIWTSDNPDVISDSGKVTRPIEEDVKVTLTATYSKGNSKTYTKEFEFTVKSFDISKIEYPYYDENVSGEYIVNDGFDSPENPKANIGQQAKGEVLIEDGMIKLSRTVSDSSSSTAFKYLFMDDQGPVSEDVVAFEFSARKSASMQTFIRLTGQNTGQSNIALNITWEANGDIKLHDGSATKTVGRYDTTEKLDFLVLVNHSLNNIYMWVNSGTGYKLLAENFKWRESFNGRISCFYAYVQKTTTTPVYFDDIRVYTPVLSDLLRAKIDRDILVYTDITPQAENNIIYNLNLPEKGIYDSTIAWTSSDESVIEIQDYKGIVKRSEDSARQVTLTATFNYGRSDSYSKEFEFTVGKISVDALPPIASGDPIYVMDSSETGTDLPYYFERTGKGFSGMYGMRVVMESSQNTDITITPKTFSKDVFSIRSENGKLFIDYRIDISDTTSSTIEVLDNFDVTGEHTYDILIDTDTNMVSAWVDSVKIAEGVYTANEITEFDSVEIISLTDITVKKVELFTPVISNQDKVLFDSEYLRNFDYLTFQDKTGVYENIALPTEGVFGSAVTWSSSNTAVLSDAGEVGEPGNTILTATIKSGNDEKKVSFNITVISQTPDESFEKIGEALYSRNFKVDDINESVTMATTDGASIAGLRRGKLMLKYYANTSADSKVMLKYPGKELTGLVGMEVEIYRDNNATVNLRAGNNDYFSAQWKGNSLTVTLREKLEDGSFKSANKTVAITNNSAKLYFFFDTENQTYSMWVNDKLALEDVYSRGEVKSVSQFSAWVNGTNYTTFQIGKVSMYRVYAPLGRRLEKDKARLSLNDILSHEPDRLDPVLVSDNLSLPERAYYGSYLTWTSATPDLVSNDGVIRFPDENEYPGHPDASITAELEDDGAKDFKTIDFKVRRNLTSDEQIVKAVLAPITEATVTSQNPDEITTSLDLSLREGDFGTSISWKSSDENVITSSGRVIRPKEGQESKNVTITVTVSCGGQELSKELYFTVLAEEVFKDPDHLTDESFFGKWNTITNSWDIEGKLDYTYNEGMATVGEVVKTVQDGDYTRANEALLTYMQNRDKKSGVTGKGDALASESYADGYLRHVAIEGTGYIEEDWKKNEISVRTSSLQKGGKVSYAISSWYNESTELLVAGLNDVDESHHPLLRVNVNGEQRYYKAEKAITIRSGNYKTTSYSGIEPLKAKTFGEFNGNETYKIMMTFNLPDVTEVDILSSAALILYSKATPPESGAKRIIVLAENNSEWDENSASWRSFTGLAFNFNGVDGEWAWIRPDGDATDQEYYYQRTRFLELPSAARLYAYTGNAYWTEGAIRAMGDFIIDTGNNPGFPRTLDCAERVKSFAEVYDTFASSENMTAEYSTAILKHMWGIADYLLVNHATSGNWITNEQTAMLYFEKYFPEFKDQSIWVDKTVEMFNYAIGKNFHEDGSYIETTSGYTNSALDQFISFRQTLLEMGVDPGEEYDEKLLKGTYYNALLIAGNGTGLAWGDANSGTKGSGVYESIAKIFNDDELRYIDNYGTKGTKPDWTSISYPDSKRILMRSDFSKNSVSLFTEVNGLGQHGHSDDNGLIVSAYGRTLLTDAGRFSYQKSGDPFKAWATSSFAHNTVIIDDTSQGKSAEMGTTDDWHTDSGFDYSEQTTKATDGFDHTRSITYVKPDLFIVSDLIVPDKLQTTHDYKQIWHMLPDAEMTLDGDERVIRSNYSLGANLLIVSPDADVSMGMEEGWYDIGYQKLLDNPYSYFERSNITGKANLDSVLIPTNTDPDATAKATRIDTGVSATVATALKLETEINGAKETGYYYLSREETPSIRIFGEFETDAKLVYIGSNYQGKITNVVIKNGSYIKKNGEFIVRLSEKATVSTTIEGRTFSISSDNIEAVKNSKISAVSTINKLLVNGEPVGFSMDGNFIQPFAENTEGDQEKEESGPSGELVPAGPSEGAGGDAEEKPQEKPTDVQDGSTMNFSDTKGHWAEKEIAELYALGVVNGRTNDKYCPDDNVTRAEFLTLIARGVGIRAAIYQGGFDDVKRGDWFADTVAAAMAQGIISKGANFRPNDPITREEMAKMICIATRLFYREDLPPGYKADYVDVRSNAWSADYINAADYFGLIRGVGNNSFEPSSTATRAQCAVIIKRAMDLIKN